MYSPCPKARIGLIKFKNIFYDHLPEDTQQVHDDVRPCVNPHCITGMNGTHCRCIIGRRRHGLTVSVAEHRSWPRDLSRWRLSLLVARLQISRWQVAIYFNCNLSQATSAKHQISFWSLFGGFMVYFETWKSVTRPLGLDFLRQMYVTIDLIQKDTPFKTYRVQILRHNSSKAASLDDRALRMRFSCPSAYSTSSCYNWLRRCFHLQALSPIWSWK